MEGMISSLNKATKYALSPQSIKQLSAPQYSEYPLEFENAKLSNRTTQNWADFPYDVLQQSRTRSRRNALELVNVR